jgi:hypothetical protein
VGSIPIALKKTEECIVVIVCVLWALRIACTSIRVELACGLLRRLTRIRGCDVFDAVLLHRVFEICAMYIWLGTKVCSW